MKHITFYLDFLSPYTWLAFERLPQPDGPALGAGGTLPHTDLVQAAEAAFTHGFVGRHTAHRHAG